MEERFLDLSEEAAGLSVRNSQLVIRQDNREETIPLEDLAAVVISHPAVHYTHAALAGVCANGGAVILCNERRLPIGMVLPLSGHYTQAERFAAQAEAAAPVKKRIWQQIIQAKILAQAHLLALRNGEDSGLTRMAKSVRSGDPDNWEGQASRRYWPALFGPDFRRVPGGDDPINRLFNYGYAVLRAFVTRAICATGLHPSLGVHHHNRYNPFCLADDLMEPFRPDVDRLVMWIIEEHGPQVPLDKDSKATLIGGLFNARYRVGSQMCGLFETLARSSASLAAVFTGDRRRLILPKLL